MKDIVGRISVVDGINQKIRMTEVSLMVIISIMRWKLLHFNFMYAFCIMDLLGLFSCSNQHDFRSYSCHPYLEKCYYMLLKVTCTTKW